MSACRGLVAGMTALLAACLLAAAPTLAAQEVLATAAPSSLVRVRDVHARPAAAMVVALEAYDAAGRPQTGAGVIVATTDRSLWIVTARHVVSTELIAGRARLFEAAPDVDVLLLREDGRRDTVPGRPHLLDSAFLAGVRADRERLSEPDSVEQIERRVRRDSLLIARYDLALVEVDLAKARAKGWRPPRLDRLGDLSALRRGDELTAVGCPTARCWDVPVRANQFRDWIPGDERRVGQLIFQSSSVEPGSSGGALFDEVFELVGIVVTTENQLAEAIPIDEVVRVLERSGLRVQWTPAQYARRGRTKAVDLSLWSPLDASGATAATGDTRLPSFRATWSARSRGAFGWHVAGQRLAPPEFALHAGIVGADYVLHTPRLSLTLGADVGYGRATSRRDLGGYWVTGGAGKPSYRPVLEVSHVLGPLVGGQATLAWMLRPRWAVALSVARWSFSVPETAAKVPSLYNGVGLRWSP